jgi:hypothetical protein
MVFNATFNNISVISWQPVLVVEEAGVPGENHRPCAIGYDPQTGGARLHLAITPDCRVISIKSRFNNYILLRFLPF